MTVLQVYGHAFNRWFWEAFKTQTIRSGSRLCCCCWPQAKMYEHGHSHQPHKGVSWGDAILH